MAVTPQYGTGRPIAPVIAPLTGGVDQRLQQLADAVSRRAVIEGHPTFSSVNLLAPDGSTWRLTVDVTGALHTVQVVRA